MHDKKFFSNLYTSLSREIYIYIYRLTGSHETAEDILHDSFANLIKYNQTKKIKENNYKAFLYRTAHNLSVNYLKKKGKIDFSSIDDTAAETKDETHEKIEFEELTKKINETIKTMDELSQSIYTMRKELNLSLNEIAKFTGR